MFVSSFVCSFLICSLVPLFVRFSYVRPFFCLFVSHMFVSSFVCSFLICSLVRLFVRSHMFVSSFVCPFLICSLVRLFVRSFLRSLSYTYIPLVCFFYKFHRRFLTHEIHVPCLYVRACNTRTHMRVTHHNLKRNEWKLKNLTTVLLDQRRLCSYYLPLCVINY